MFTEISIWGRIAYAICCLENYILTQGYSKQEWKVVFELLWSFHDEEFYDEWLFKVAEFLPENILETDLFEEEGDWDFVDEELFYQLHELYSTTPDIEQIGVLLQGIHDICCCELYDVATPPAPKSLLVVDKFYHKVEQMKFQLPDIRFFRGFQLHTNACWGTAMRREELLIPFAFD